MLIFLLLIPFALATPLNRSEHVEQMPIERDGELNDKFRQEMIFSHHLDSSDAVELARSIREMFELTDTDKDGQLTPLELKLRVQRNMLEHFEKSKNDSDAFFEIIDRNGDGWIVWSEFEPHFEKMNGGGRKEQLMEVPTEDPLLVETEKRTFNRSDESRDGRLDRKEWHVFLHPEYSPLGLDDIVTDLIALYDSNSDHQVSREEFVDGAPGNVDVSNPDFLKMEQAEKARRRAEFDEEIDANSDGIATFIELHDYVDPQNFRMAAKEVNDIIMLADANDDGKLSLEELLDRDWLLERSSLLSARKSLHDEM